MIPEITLCFGANVMIKITLQVSRRSGSGQFCSMLTLPLYEDSQDKIHENGFSSK
jgi:hypothetical protein